MNKKILAVVIVVCAAIALVVVVASSLHHNIIGGNPLPENLDIAYKEIQLRGLPPIERYAVIDTAGYIYFVTEEAFQNLNVTQRIGDNLYMLPDGSLLTCCGEER